MYKKIITTILLTIFSTCIPLLAQHDSEESLTMIQEYILNSTVANKGHYHIVFTEGFYKPNDIFPDKIYKAKIEIFKKNDVGTYDKIGTLRGSTFPKNNGPNDKEKPKEYDSLTYNCEWGIILGTDEFKNYDLSDTSKRFYQAFLSERDFIYKKTVNGKLDSIDKKYKHKILRLYNESEGTGVIIPGKNISSARYGYLCDSIIVREGKPNIIVKKDMNLIDDMIEARYFEINKRFDETSFSDKYRYLLGVQVHLGWRSTNGSKGCLTIHPDDEESFFKSIEDNKSITIEVIRNKEIAKQVTSRRTCQTAMMVFYTQQDDEKLTDIATLYLMAPNENMEAAQFNNEFDNLKTELSEIKELFVDEISNYSSLRVILKGTFPELAKNPEKLDDISNFLFSSSKNRFKIDGFDYENSTRLVEKIIKQYDYTILSNNTSPVQEKLLKILNIDKNWDNEKLYDKLSEITGIPELRDINDLINNIDDLYDEYNVMDNDLESIVENFDAFYKNILDINNPNYNSYSNGIKAGTQVLSILNKYLPEDIANNTKDLITVCSVAASAYDLYEKYGGLNTLGDIATGNYFSLFNQSLSVLGNTPNPESKHHQEIMGMLNKIHEQMKANHEEVMGEFKKLNDKIDLYFEAVFKGMDNIQDKLSEITTELDTIKTQNEEIITNLQNFKDEWLYNEYEKNYKDKFLVYYDHFFHLPSLKSPLGFYRTNHISLDSVQFKQEGISKYANYYQKIIFWTYRYTNSKIYKSQNDLTYNSLKSNKNYHTYYNDYFKYLNDNKYVLFNNIPEHNFILFAEGSQAILKFLESVPELNPEPSNQLKKLKEITEIAQNNKDFFEELVLTNLDSTFIHFNKITDAFESKIKNNINTSLAGKEQSIQLNLESKTKKLFEESFIIEYKGESLDTGIPLKNIFNFNEKFDFSQHTYLINSKFKFKIEKISVDNKKEEFWESFRVETTITKGYLKCIGKFYSINAETETLLSEGSFVIYSNNDKIYQITKMSNTQLQFDFQNFNGVKRFIKYKRLNDITFYPTKNQKLSNELLNQELVGELPSLYQSFYDQKDELLSILKASNRIILSPELINHQSLDKKMSELVSVKFNVNNSEELQNSVSEVFDLINREYKNIAVDFLNRSKYDKYLILYPLYYQEMNRVLKQIEYYVK